MDGSSKVIKLHLGKPVDKKLSCPTVLELNRSYVGVYLTYVAVRVIVLFGLVMRFSKPHSEKPGAFGNAAKALSDGMYVFATTAEKLSSEAEKATAEMRAKAEAERAEKARERANAVSDTAPALRRAKLAKYRLSLELQDGTVTREVFDTETAKIDREIAEIEKMPPLASSDS